MTPDSAVNPAFPDAAVERWQLWEGKARRRIRRAKTEAQIVGDRENEGRPESRSRRSASVHGVIPGAGWRIDGDPLGRNTPDEGFGVEKESPVSGYGPRRRTSPKVSSVEEWWHMGQEREMVESTQVDARRGRFGVCASVERSRWQWWVGRGGK